MAVRAPARSYRIAPTWHPRPGAWVGAALVLPGAALLVLFFVWPLVNLVRLSFADLSVSAYGEFFGSRADLMALGRTALMAVVVTGGSLLLGGWIAWELRTARSRLKQALIAFAVVFPLWTSLIVRNYALTVIMQREGIINDFLRAVGLVEDPLRILYSSKAVFIGMLYIMVPYAALPLYASLVNVDLDLVRAARSLGASSLGAFRSVVLPLVVPAILATGALVFVLSLGFFVTPLLLGGGTSPFIASRISNTIFVFFDLPRAAAASSILLAGAIVCLVAVWLTVGPQRIQRAVAGGR